MSLTRLLIDINLLRKLPDVVLKLPSLAVLQAAGNAITHLPEGLEHMRSLQGLILSTNQVSCGMGGLGWTMISCYLHIVVTTAAAGRAYLSH